MPENSNLWLLRGHRFGQKIEFTVMTPNHGGEPLGFILGPMGSHWAKKWVKTVKKLPCPKILIVDYSAVIDLGPSWCHWGQKFGQNRQKLPCPKIRIFEYGHRFGQKIKFTVMAPNHGWDTLGSILGPMGSIWDQNMGQNRQKLPCPKIRIFHYSAVIDLGK